MQERYYIKGRSPQQRTDRAGRAYLCASRNAANLKQQDLADLLGVSRELFSMWEHGTRFLPWERCIQLSEHLPDTAGTLFCRHNVDMVRLYIDRLPPDARVPKNLGMSMLRKLQMVMSRSPEYSDKDLSRLRETYRELMQRTLFGTPAGEKVDASYQHGLRNLR